MKVQHVNTGKKASYRVKGTVIELTVPNVEPITIDLNGEQRDVASVVDVSLNSDFTKLEKGVGNWYVASIKLPAREYDLEPTGEVDEDGYDIMEEVAAPLSMRDVTLCLWGIPEIQAETTEESEVM